MWAYVFSAAWPQVPQMRPPPGARSPSSDSQPFAPHAVHVYGHASEPTYFGRSAAVWRIAAGVDRLTPNRLRPTLMVFVQKAAG